MYNNATTGLRWFSQMNPWMDCLVLVKADDVEKAEQAIRKGVEEFWDDECLCYGDCIEAALHEAEVEYIIEYCPEYDDDNPFAEEEWDAQIMEHISNGITIKNIG